MGKSDTDVQMLFCVVETDDGKLRVVDSSCRFTPSGVSVQRKDMRPTADGVTASCGVSPSGRSPNYPTDAKGSSLPPPSIYSTPRSTAGRWCSLRQTLVYSVYPRHVVTPRKFASAVLRWARREIAEQVEYFPFQGKGKDQQGQVPPGRRSDVIGRFI